ncbi:putative Cystatin domain-containing protein [Dioscorea sansibarensis]
MASRLAHVLLLFAIAFTALSAYATAGIVGGRTEIKNVRSNKLVQSLGKFAVEEYDRGLKGSNALLSFSSVISAESQVVSGTKYYLKIAAKDSHHARKLFDAEVVVKPWLKSKELLSFKPTPK